MPRPKKQHLKRQKDGRYFCKSKDGKMHSGRSEEEAMEKRKAYERALELGLPGKPKPVGEYAVQWLPLHKNGVSRKCYNDYAKQMQILVDAIGDMYFQDVTPDDALRIYQHYAGYSQSTIKRARMLFISFFDAAIENGYCRKNPFRSRFAQPDRGTEGTHRIITLEERDLILKTPHRMRLAALVMLYAGLRRGEALAVYLPADVDFARGVIRVAKAVRFDGNNRVITNPKTASGIREIPLLPILADELRGLSGWLVQSVDGKPATESAFSRGWENYQTVLSRAAGHKVSIRCHDLRHSYCTMLRDAGVDMKLAMTWLGHADEKMILRIYDHVTDERVAENAEKVIKRLLSLRNGLQGEE